MFLNWVHESTRSVEGEGKMARKILFLKRTECENERDEGETSCIVDAVTTAAAGEQDKHKRSS